MYPIGLLQTLSTPDFPLKLSWNAVVREQKMGQLCL
jgi:hypothetical protein